ncbi:hypothetical protein TrLO_g8552 [Triparma laevis f. longispina]|uniref:Uncharacterized protein n=1 Tax=Triparma laevis f. longispina TaxID=1714387 RepID=A0A9W7FKE8_9STRA|nr:hypothetical protein TrLO_g8552 [Triparma laevis f. longispina]
MAEFILIPTAVLVEFILHLKGSEDMVVGDKCNLSFSCFMLVIILVTVFGLFISGVNLTTQLEEVTHKISELKSHEILFEGVGERRVGCLLEAVGAMGANGGGHRSWVHALQDTHLK